MDIDINKISDETLKKFGNLDLSGKQLKNISKKDMKLWIDMAFKLGFWSTGRQTFLEKEMEELLMKAIVVMSMETFVRKGIIRREGIWYSPKTTYVETEFGKLARKLK